ncbi:hypothetical protein K435DRAFT_966583 [Dendrothele bispora CBS 962.96]|uniref:Uncharacterized protein n=1 Tax=Dendrothele bispora (strain CBS 962.96) TaxID=1314807 RepID=A0A4S8LZH1_DENBC|nr:hypothetical protein K435DRAFT_966583 [Dendrothele bispora CBS 962.96]
MESQDSRGTAPPPYSESTIESTEIIAVTNNPEFASRRAPSIDSLPENPVEGWTPAPLEDPFVIEQPGPVLAIPVPPLPSPAPKKRGRPKKNPEPTASVGPVGPEPVPIPSEPVPPPIITFSTALSVVMPESVSRSRNGKTKTTKVPPKSFGPIEANIGVSWDEYADLIRKELQCADVRQLQVSSFYWHFEGKKNTLLGLQNQSHLEQLFKRLQARTKGEKFIVLVMDPPLKVIKRTDSLPWASPKASDASNTQPETLLVPTTGVDEDQLSDDDNVGPMAKKARLDDDLEEIVTKIARDYHGKCDQHSMISCFYHKPTKQHFDVGDRRRALQWAAKIRREKDKPVPAVDITRIPIGEGYFAAAHALKCTNPVPSDAKEPSSAPTASPPIPATSGPAPSTPVTPAGAVAASIPGFFGADTMSAVAQMTAAAQMGMLMNPMLAAGYGHFMSSHTPTVLQTPVRSRDGNFTMRSSSPPLPDDALSLDEFCVQNNFNDKVKSRLMALEFEPGDNLIGVTEKVWSEVGFTQLSWDRVVKANRQYRKSRQ